MKNNLKPNPSTFYLNDIKHDYLNVAFQCCKDFEERIRRQGAKSFNVFLFLEQEFRKHFVSENLNRKPPKAVTIEQWFNSNHLSGSKMGTEDLKLICRFINNSDAIVAFYEETIKDFFPNSKEIITDTATLNSLVLKLGALQGSLFDEFNNAIPNGISNEEAARITASTEAIKYQCEKIISKCSLTKVS